jgi:hypothetical protein
MEGINENKNYFVDGDFIIRQKLTNTFLKNYFTRKVAYLIEFFCRSIILNFYNCFFRKKMQFKNKVSICAMFKNEAEFLNEWINFHLNIGVDYFYLYNNNSNDGFRDILEPYIKEGLVELIDWPYDNSLMQAFEDCYKKNRFSTNWLAYIDIDEFICPIVHDNIKSWLSGYDNLPGVAVYWKQFGSNGKLTHNTDQLVIEQYTQCWPKYSTFTKMFCNMNYPISNFLTPHYLKSKIWNFDISPCNEYKKMISFGINKIATNRQSSIQINHYWGKAFDRFQDKLNRSDSVYSDSKRMMQIRKNLLKSHEAMCTDRDYTIQKYLLYTKLKNILKE